MQETEIDVNVPVNILGNSQYKFEPEKSTLKKRVGLYVNKQVIYKRREDLEENNMHLIIIDIKTNVSVRLISLYRTFRPTDGKTPTEFFQKQIEIIERNRTPRTIIVGDFNLDANMQFRLDYPHKHLYNFLNEFIVKFNFNQIVDFSTWSRTINNIQKESILDHVYTNDFLILEKCHFLTPNFGDHLIVVIDLKIATNLARPIIFRNWHNY